jgi:pilus assembly protein CpaC
MKNFGISLQNLSNVAGNFAFGLLNGRSILGTTAAVSATGNPYTAAASGGSLFASYNDGGNSINSVIDALESDGLVTTLDEPTLTTQSGQPASFLEGGQIPVPQISGSGASATVGIQYEPYGVSLSFIPVVLSKDRINLTVSPTVSALSQTGAITTAGFTVPALTTRQATTTVELGSGQSFAIAGLIENDRSNDISKFPFLGDVPVLGTLFRSSQFQHNQTELVIIVTPYIVGAVDSAKALHDPTQGLIMASDAERILLGKLYKEQPAGYYYGEADNPHLQGAAGYQLK